MLIDEGAKAEYELASLTNRPAAWSALLLYAAGGLIVAWLVAQQTGAVFRAAGWW
jgi:hypothetical protein